jgi:hypothetical protein
MRPLHGLLSSVLASGIFLLALAAAAPVTSNNPEANRALLRDMRSSDPEHYGVLVRNFERFQALSPQQQEKLRQLDRQLHEEDSQTQARLTHALSEYAAWLTRLPERDRQRILSAADSAERLRIIREIKERQWFERLPVSQRNEWQTSSESKRKELIERWHKEEQAQRELWAEARRRWDDALELPMPLSAQEEAIRQMKVFVEKRLTPMLNLNERDRLRRAEEERLIAPFAMLRVIIELSERHPVLALEPRNLTYESLPAEYKKALQSLPKSAEPAVNRLPSGVWPRYPVEVTDVLRKYNVAPKQQLGPASAADFPPNVQQFIEQKLKPKLTSAEAETLKKAEGRWPEYPLALHDLARQHKLVIPELSLPIDPQRLENMKLRRSLAGSSLPEPPEYMLREFALKLMMDNPDGPNLSLSNPVDREIIKKKFFEKHPEMLEKLRQQDKQKMDKKGKAKP